MKFPVPILLLACLACRSVPHDGGDRSIVTIVHEQEAAWNRGDIEGFMQTGYWRSPDLTFFSGGSDTRGFDPVLARYTKRYKGEGKEMGRLAFTKLEVVPLADDCALARGRWDLDFKSENDVGGLFSLVFRRTDVGWRIVHDHTSIDGVVAAQPTIAEPVGPQKIPVKNFVKVLSITCDLAEPARSFIQVRYLPAAGVSTALAVLRTGDPLAPQHPGIVVEAIEPGVARFKFTDGRASETLSCSEFD